MSIADKAIETVTKNISLEIKLKDAEAKIIALQQEHVKNQSVLCSEIENLKASLNQERNKNEVLEQQLRVIHSITLNENHEKVLIAVAKFSGQPPETFARATGLSKEEITAKLNYLSSLRLLHFRSGFVVVQDDGKRSSVDIWFVSDLGHTYIKAHNLNDKIA